jgi:hypothetical protein
MLANYVLTPSGISIWVVCDLLTSIQHRLTMSNMTSVNVASSIPSRVAPCSDVACSDSPCSARISSGTSAVGGAWISVSFACPAKLCIVCFHISSVVPSFVIVRGPPAPATHAGWYTRSWAPLCLSHGTCGGMTPEHAAQITGFQNPLGTEMRHTVGPCGTLGCFLGGSSWPSANWAIGSVAAWWAA